MYHLGCVPKLSDEAGGQGYRGNNSHGFIINNTGQWVHGSSQVFSLCLDIFIIKKKKI